MPNRKRLKVWRFFEELEGDYTKVKCLVTGCSSILSRGKPGSKRGDLNSNNMVRHVREKHPEQHNTIVEEEKAAAKANEEHEEYERKKNETEKGGNKIWQLKTQKERMSFLKG